MLAGGVKSPVHTTGLGSVRNGDVKTEEGEGGSNVQESGSGEGSSGGPSEPLPNGGREEDTAVASDPQAPPSAGDGTETTPPQSSQPVIPPRPYRPPRPFPPPSATSKSPPHSTSSRQKNRTHHGDPRYLG